MGSTRKMPKASELGSTPSLAKALYTLASSEGLRNSVAVKKFGLMFNAVWLLFLVKYIYYIKYNIYAIIPFQKKTSLRHFLFVQSNSYFF